MTARLLSLACIAISLLGAIQIQAQPALRLYIGASAEGELLPGERDEFELAVLQLNLLSLRVTALDASLDPVLEVYDPNGALVIANDDVDYPESQDALIQAYVVPQSATYRIVLRGYDGSSGAYRLQILPGFDQIAQYDTSMNRYDWNLVRGEGDLRFTDVSAFAIEMQGYVRTAMLLGSHFPQASDYYFEAQFLGVEANFSWRMGLVFAYVAPDDYARLWLSKTGYWRIERMAGDELSVLRDWTTHPAIVAGASAFRLGILRSGTHIDIVYDRQVIGSVQDTSDRQPGALGLAMRTDDEAGSKLSAVVGETLMTLPTKVDGKLVFPRWLKHKQNYLMAQDFARHQIAPPGGLVELVQASSSVRHFSPGVSRLGIYSERQFEQFAIGATVNLSVANDGNGGCGISFHTNNDSNYSLAYFTHDGDYGLSRRDDAGFAPGIYGRREPPIADTQTMLIIALDDALHYYLNEVYVGSLPSQPRVGSIGIAVVNYEVAESNCQFDDLWLMTFAPG